MKRGKSFNVIHIVIVRNMKLLVLYVIEYDIATIVDWVICISYLVTVAV